MQLTVRDLRGRPLFRVDTTEDVARDVDTGKVVAARVDEGPDAELTARARFAAYCMRDDQKVLMDLGPADVQFPATKAEWGTPRQSEMPGERIADLVSPVTFVKRDRGYWFGENVLDTIDPINANIAETGEPAKVDPQYKSTQFTTNGYALATQIRYELLNNADFDIRKRSIRRLAESLRLSREMRVAQLLTTATNWAAGQTFVTPIKWKAGTNPTPLTDLFTALQDSLLPADSLILSENVAPFFYFVGGTGAQIRDYVQSGGKLPRIITATAKYSVSAPAGGATPQYVWATGATGWNVPLVRAGTDIQKQETDILTTRTLRWLGDESVKDGKVVDGVLVREYDHPPTRSRYVVVAHNDAEIMQSNQVGTLIQTVS